MDRRLCLITGANGFVGSALLNAITRQASVESSNILAIGAVRSKSNLDRINDSPLVEVGDINSQTDWSAALSSVDCVVHTAARAHFLRDPAISPIEEFRLVNVAGTVRLAKQCLEFGISRFIYISSIGVNGDETRGFSFNEECPPNPISPYAISKMEAETELKNIFFNSKIELVIIRPTLVYGVNPPGNFGRLFRAVQLGLPLPLGAIKNNRSFIGIDNLCDFILTCIEHPLAANQTFLISDGIDISTTNLLLTIGKALNKPVNLISFPPSLLVAVLKLFQKENMAKQLFGDLRVDISKSEKILDWSPQFTLQEGLKRALNISLHHED